MEIAVTYRRVYTCVVGFLPSLGDGDLLSTNCTEKRLSNGKLLTKVNFKNFFQIPALCYLVSMLAKILFAKGFLGPSCFELWDFKGCRS